MQELSPEVLNGISDELRKKAKACKSPEELAALLGEAGVELPGGLLDNVVGGYQNRQWTFTSRL